jgi:MFS family permease
VEQDESYKHLKRQLLIVAGAQGAIFWYAIEKLFYIDSGVTMQGVVLLGLVAQLPKVVLEIPTSVLADRWSRRNALISANVLMVVSSLIIGLSSHLAGFVVGLLVWSVSDSLRSGVYEAFTYDGLKSIGWQSAFRKLYTRMWSVELVVMTFAGIASGFIGRYTDMRVNFFLTIPIVLVAVLTLLKMKEPPIKRTTEIGENWLKHLSGSMKILKKPTLIWVVALYVAMLGLTRVWFSSYQLVGIDVRLPEVFFGFLIAAITGGQVLGVEFAHRFPAKRRFILALWLVITCASTIGLLAVSPLGAMANILVLFVGLRAARVFMEVYLHDRIPSERRATIFSLSESISYLVCGLLTVAISVLLHTMSIRPALIIVSVPLIIMAVIDVLKKISWASEKTAPLDPEMEVK